MELQHAARILLTKARQFFGDGIGNPSGVKPDWGNEIVENERVFITRILPGSQCTIVNEGNDFCAGNVFNKPMSWAHPGILNVKWVRRSDDERVIDFPAEDDRWKPSGEYIYREYNRFQRCLPIRHMSGK